MHLNTFFTLSWTLKRNIWQIALVASLLISLLLAPLIIQITLASLCVLRFSSDLWSYYRFKSYSLNNTNNEPRTVQAILTEFEQQRGSLSFYGLSRQSIVRSIRKIMNDGCFKQTNNNLCGPIAFLNFLIAHHPALFVKTICEYAENGCTQAPFYIQSSFWDRYAYFHPIGLINNLFPNHYDDVPQALAGAFKNTHNFLGYNNSSWFESYKGVTRPLQIQQWLEQAGFNSVSNCTINNYYNSNEMPLFYRTILGGLYGDNNRESSLNNLVDRHETNYCFIELSQVRGGTPLHYLFNVAGGHWTFKEEPTSNQNRISISLRHNNR